MTNKEAKIVTHNKFTMTKSTVGGLIGGLAATNEVTNLELNGETIIKDNTMDYVISSGAVQTGATNKIDINGKVYITNNNIKNSILNINKDNILNIKGKEFVVSGNTFNNEAVNKSSILTEVNGAEANVSEYKKNYKVTTFDSSRTCTGAGSN